MAIDAEHEVVDPEEVARRVAAHIVANDQPLRALGIEVEEVGPGHARARMQVRADMLNSHSTCHGGVIFSLADCVFAIACNTHDRDAVAAACSIEFLAPVHSGDVLVATAAERSLRGRTGIYDVTVSDRTGAPVALFRGRSRQLAGSNGRAGRRAGDGDDGGEQR